MIRPLVVVLCAAAASALQIAIDQRPTFRSRTDLVTVDVSVTSGRIPAQGLTLQDFALTDNRVPQRLELLDAESLPLDLTVVLDNSGSMQRAVKELQADVTTIAGMLRPSDRLRLFTFAREVRETMEFRHPSADLVLKDLGSTGSTSLFDAVAAAMMRAPEGDRRHLVVVLTDGEDTSSLLGQASLNEISRHADAVLYAAVSSPAMPVSSPPPPRGMPVDRATRRRPWAPVMSAQGEERPLRDAVENTGGVWDSMLSIGSAPSGVTRALEWFRAAYVLRYRAVGVPPDGWHELRVRVVRPGDYEVRARKGYFGESRR